VAVLRDGIADTVEWQPVARVLVMEERHPHACRHSKNHAETR
jgi:hypothetical protein